MGSSLCSKGFLLLLFLQMKWLLCVNGQDSTTQSSTSDSMSTMLMNTSMPMATDESTITSISQMPNSTSIAITMSSLPANTAVTNSGLNSTDASMQLSCRVLSCNCSMCYSMFMNVNSTVCQANSKYCELRRDDTMNYSAKCATECPVYCNSTTQVNCSVSCCGSETCFNDTMKHLHHNSCMPMSTTQSTITTTTTTATKPVTTTTVVTNGKKCHKISCTGDTCYQGSTNMMLCSTQHYCVLKKTTSGTMVTWTGGCSDDCTKDTVCTSTTTTCSLECCNATTTSSCLKLTGAVNMPGSATRQPFSPILLMTSLLTLWLISKAISA